jgi:hypothetical protein
MMLRVHLRQPDRRWVAWAHFLFRRTGARPVRAARPDRPLEQSRWHQESAEACIEEARRLFVDGIECLLKAPVTVTCDRGDPCEFVCRAGTAAPDGARLILRPCADSPEPVVPGAVFHPPQRSTLAAFAQGLQRLAEVGAFAGAAAITLVPNGLGAAAPRLLAAHARTRPPADRRNVRRSGRAS